MELPGYRDYNQWIKDTEGGNKYPLPMKHV